MTTLEAHENVLGTGNLAYIWRHNTNQTKAVHCDGKQPALIGNMVRLGKAPATTCDTVKCHV